MQPLTKAEEVASKSKCSIVVSPPKSKVAITSGAKKVRQPRQLPNTFER